MKMFMRDEDYAEMDYNPAAKRLYNLGFFHGAATMLIGIVIGEFLVALKLYLQG